jgi:LPXTG-motif cell wall-anchored protein
MKYLKSLSSLFLFALISAALPSGAQADDNVQRRSRLTITEPTEIPGTVLQPGTYLVKVMDFQDEKLIVQFVNENDTKVIATVLAMRDRRVLPDDGQTGFTYYQRTPGGLNALKSWYYAGDYWGEVFVYPRSKAVVIAKATSEEVVATPAESAPTLKSEVVVIKPDETLQPIPQPAVKASEPTTKVAESLPARLPETGSSLPLIALAGFVALGCAAGLHLMRYVS